MKPLVRAPYAPCDRSHHATWSSPDPSATAASYACAHRHRDRAELRRALGGCTSPSKAAAANSAPTQRRLPGERMRGGWRSSQFIRGVMRNVNRSVADRNPKQPVPRSAGNGKRRFRDRHYAIWIRPRVDRALQRSVTSAARVVGRPCRHPHRQLISLADRVRISPSWRCRTTRRRTPASRVLRLSASTTNGVASWSRSVTMPF